jgi:mRNA-degrading endonuclease toxin of MazEF toxin-antitoxin module
MAEQGDIVLIPIPFTDLSSQKRRPVIIISNNAYNRKTADMVVGRVNKATLDLIRAKLQELTAERK